jgi:hypothetical protein
MNKRADKKQLTNLGGIWTLELNPTPLLGAAEHTSVLVFDGPSRALLGFRFVASMNEAEITRALREICAEVGPPTHIEVEPSVAMTGLLKAWASVEGIAILIRNPARHE